MEHYKFGQIYHVLLNLFELRFDKFCLIFLKYIVDKYIYNDFSSFRLFTSKL